MNNIKLKIWHWFLNDIVNHPESMIMPRWLILVKCVLFPIKAIRYISLNCDGYQFQNNTWLIYGNRYSDELFKYLAFGNVGDVLKIVNRVDGVVTLEKQ